MPQWGPGDGMTTRTGECVRGRFHSDRSSLPDTARSAARRSRCSHTLGNSEAWRCIGRQMRNAVLLATSKCFFCQVALGEARAHICPSTVTFHHPGGDLMSLLSRTIRVTFIHEHQCLLPMPLQAWLRPFFCLWLTHDDCIDPSWCTEALGAIASRV
jgi:hypothetical protein